MKKVIVSAFEPFDNAKTNPSYEAAKLFPKRIGEADIEVMRLPVVSVGVWISSRLLIKGTPFLISCTV